MKCLRINTMGHPRHPLQSGYTLVELMAVLTIIGVLSSIAVQKYSRHKAKILVKGEVYSVLSPWIRDCRSRLRRGQSDQSCWRCRGGSAFFSFKQAVTPHQCRVTARRDHAEFDRGDSLLIRIDSDGQISFRGPLAPLMH